MMLGNMDHIGNSICGETVVCEVLNFVRVVVAVAIVLLKDGTGLTSGDRHSGGDSI